MIEPLLTVVPMRFGCNSAIRMRQTEFLRAAVGVDARLGIEMLEIVGGSAHGGHPSRPHEVLQPVPGLSSGSSQMR
ncbi:hypothetical protein CSC70_10110 [Pseudoxanthomonas kalamensis DSM 18571]|nr:hypothetical protein CSC70_10110 [Pseudoxanthomonas kalamensis DSM 18571]